MKKAGSKSEDLVIDYLGRVKAMKVLENMDQTFDVLASDGLSMPKIRVLASVISYSQDSKNKVLTPKSVFKKINYRDEKKVFKLIADLHKV